MGRIPISRIKKEVDLSTTKSGGPGGQHVNKVETKVLLRFNIKESKILSDEEKNLLLDKLKNQLTKGTDLIITSNSQRSQIKNKEIAFKKLDRVLARAFSIQKSRQKTKPTKSSVEKRIKTKKQQSEKKKWRRKL